MREHGQPCKETSQYFSSHCEKYNHCDALWLKLFVSCGFVSWMSCSFSSWIVHKIANKRLRWRLMNCLKLLILQECCSKQFGWLDIQGGALILLAALDLHVGKSPMATNPGYVQSGCEMIWSFVWGSWGPLRFVCLRGNIFPEGIAEKPAHSSWPIQWTQELDPTVQDFLKSWKKESHKVTGFPERVRWSLTFVRMEGNGGTIKSDDWWEIPCNA